MSSIIYLTMPLFLTTRKYNARIRERDEAREQLQEFQDLETYLGIARDMRNRAVSEVSNTPEGQDMAMNLAIEWAKDETKRRIVEEYARQKRVELEADQIEELKKEFLKTDQARIDAEVAAEVAKLEENQRQQVARNTEYELKRLKREDMLAKIGTDEAEATLQRFGALALVEAQHALLIEELKAKAKLTSSVEIADLPADTVLTVGLSFTPRSSKPTARQRAQIYTCDRALTLRVLDPADGILEVMDDSWMNSDDPVKQASAVDDLTPVTFPLGSIKHNNARFSHGVEPDLFDQAEEPINFYGLETRVVAINDQVIFDN